MVDTIELDGVVYRRYPNAKTKAHRMYYSKGRRTDGIYFREYYHVVLYVKHFGNIPKGYVIHHKDFNNLNNDISNLEMLTISDHTKIHKNALIKERVCLVCKITYKSRAIICLSEKCKYAYYYSKDKLQYRSSYGN